MAPYRPISMEIKADMLLLDVSQQQMKGFFRKASCMSENVVIVMVGLDQGLYHGEPDPP